MNIFKKFGATTTADLVKEYSVSVETVRRVYCLWKNKVC